MYRARGDKYVSKSSSSGTDSDKKECKTPERNFVRKYIFTNGGDKIKINDKENNTCVYDRKSPVTPLKGILKNSSKVKELDNDLCNEKKINGHNHVTVKSV